MENKEKGKKVRFIKADWFSLAAIIVFAFLTFLGFSFKFNGNQSVFYTLVYIALSVVLLISLRWMKRQDKNIKRWKIVEIIVAVATFVVFILAVDKPMIRTLSVLFVDKSSLQADARDDIDSMRYLFTEYEMNEEDAINKTQTLLLSYYYYPKIRPMLESSFGKSHCNYDEVKTFVRARYNDYLSRDGARAEMEATGIDGDYKTFKDEMETRINDISFDVENFGFFNIPKLGMQNGYYSISQTGNEIVTFLEKKRTKTNPDGYYYLFDAEMSVIPAEPYMFDSRFKTSFDRTANVKIADYFKLWLPVLLSIICNLLMFFSYFVSFRSTKVEISKRSKSKSKPLGGVIIG